MQKYAFLSLLALTAAPAFAIVQFGASSQTVKLTGIGGNTNGQGQDKLQWGTCAFDGTTTTCTISGPFTGFGNGGTYSLVVSYAGNGDFPFIGVSTTPGSDFFYAQADSNFDFVLTLAENNGPTTHFYSFANFSIIYPSATCSGSPRTCSVGQVVLTPGSTISGVVTGSFDPTPSVSPAGVISALNYGGFPQIAPATWIEIYGINLATTRSQTWAGADFNGNLAPSALAGTKVTIGGKPAFVDFVSPGQANVQVPTGIPNGTQNLTVTTVGGTSVAYPIQVNATEPGLLAPAAFLVNGKQNVVALFANTNTFVLPNTVSGAATARAKPGDSLTMYGIGFGPVTPDIPAGLIVTQTSALVADFRMTIGGTPAQVTYAGFTPGFVGLYQFNVVVPNVPANDTTPVTYTLGGAPGPQNLVIAIRN